MKSNITPNASAKASVKITLIAAVFFAQALLLQAVDIQKANNTDNLNLDTSWGLPNAPGAGDVAVWQNTVSSANSTLLGGNLAWSGIRIADPSGEITIGGANTLTIGAAGIDMSAATQNLTLNSAVALNVLQTLNVGAGRTLTVNGALSSNNALGYLTKTGAGTLVLAGTNSFAAGSILRVNNNIVGSEGIIRLESSGALGTLAFDLKTDRSSSNSSAIVELANGITIGSNKRLVVSGHTNSSVLRNVSGNNTWNGTISAEGFNGHVAIESAAASLTLGGTISSQIATQIIGLIGTGGDIVLSSSSLLADGGANADNFQFGGTLAGRIGLASSTVRIERATNTYTGVTSIGTGILEVAALADINTVSSIGKGSVAGSAADLVFDGGTLRYTGATAQTTNRQFTLTTAGGTIDSSGSDNGNALNFTNTGAITLTGTGIRTLTLKGVNTADNTLSAAITNQGANATSVVKSESGSWNLDGTNSYTGTTVINAGTLLINGDSSTATGAVQVNSGGTLGGRGLLGGATSVATLATLAPGTSDSAGILTISSDLTFSDVNSKVDFLVASGARGTDFDAVDVGGLLTYNGDLTLTINAALSNGTYNLFSFGSQTGDFDSVVFAGGFYTDPFSDQGAGVWEATSSGQTFSFSQGSGTLLVVPEPSSMVFLLIGAGVLLISHQRRSENRKKSWV